MTINEQPVFNINEVSEECREYIRKHVHGKDIRYVLGYNHEYNNSGLKYKVMFNPEDIFSAFIEYTNESIISTPEILENIDFNGAKPYKKKKIKTKTRKRKSTKYISVFGSVNRKLDL